MLEIQEYSYNEYFYLCVIDDFFIYRVYQVLNPQAYQLDNHLDYLLDSQVDNQQIDQQHLQVVIDYICVITMSISSYFRFYLIANSI